jgi:hypothetical protein
LPITYSVVYVVDENIEPSRVETDADRVVDLLAASERGVADAAFVVVEAVAFVLGVDGGPAHGAVERDRSRRQVFEGPNAAVLEGDRDGL